MVRKPCYTQCEERLTTNTGTFTWEDEGVKRDGMTFAGLMRESTDCVEHALHSDNAAEQMVAMRIV